MSNQVTRTQAIKNFLTLKTHADLASMYNYNMEVQCNVAQDNGERVDGEFKGKHWSAWTDGIQTWKSFRIPYNANGDPTYDDRPMTFDLAIHVEGIGMTGWDWVNRESLWVGYDFDALLGHSERHAKKLTEQELRDVQKAVTELNWVTVRKSTGGRGLHLYVKLNKVKTKNHTEHAALARAILGKMSAITGFDFQSKVDTCGGNLWVYHRKMIGTDGLTLVKEGVVLEDIPANWEDHIQVTSGKRKRVLPKFVMDAQSTDIESAFEEVTSKRSHVPLDAGHEKLIRFMEETNCVWMWDQDSKMLTTHTYFLKLAHEKLSLKGIFDTISKGKDAPNDVNCFCFPTWNGGWVVRRFSPGTQETSNWEQDGKGYTRCYYNMTPDLKTASRTFEGVEDEKGGFSFTDATSANLAAKQLGTDLRLPIKMQGRETRLSIHKDGRLKVEVAKEDRDDGGEMKGWIPTKTKKHWFRIFDSIVATPVESETANYDDMIRHTVTEEDGKDYQTGWNLRTDGVWRMKKKEDVKIYFRGIYDRNSKEIDQILGSCIAKPWTVVCRPFEPEFLGDRMWNCNAAQLKYIPTEDRSNLSYPHWMKILNHIGSGLDEAVERDAWCKANGVLKGADYLKCWIASMFQEPEQPLPYLFLYSQTQATGKSIFHEALSLLMIRGVKKADTALINQSGFNGELEGAVLCYIEETDLRVNKGAGDRIKDWVTSPTLQVHVKGCTPYPVVNTTHWIQTANDVSYCPVMSGDTRITMIEVPALDPLDMIPKKHLFPLLEKEAPDFLAEVLNIELPPSPDRLNLPIIQTDIKEMTQAVNETSLEKFIKEECFEVPGEMIKWGEFYDRFYQWLDPHEREFWGKVKTGRRLPHKYPKGRSHKDVNQYYIANISFTKPHPDAPLKPPYYLQGDKLMIKGVNL